MRPPSHRRTHRKSTGFSLVEVVLALGIVAVAMVPLCGLLPLCLSTAQTATELSRREQIVHKIVSSLEETPFQKLITQGSVSDSYSFEGGPISPAHPEYFVVTGTVQPSVTIPGGPASASMATVRFTITTPDRRVNHYSAIVADNGL